MKNVKASRKNDRLLPTMEELEEISALEDCLRESVKDGIAWKNRHYEESNA